MLILEVEVIGVGNATCRLECTSSLSSAVVRSEDTSDIKVQEGT